jgi:hypothetical protein
MEREGVEKFTEQVKVYIFLTLSEAKCTDRGHQRTFDIFEFKY